MSEQWLPRRRYGLLALNALVSFFGGLSAASGEWVRAVWCYTIFVGLVALQIVLNELDYHRENRGAKP